MRIRARVGDLTEDECGVYIIPCNPEELPHWPPEGRLWLRSHVPRERLLESGEEGEIEMVFIEGYGFSVWNFHPDETA